MAGPAFQLIDPEAEREEVSPEWTEEDEQRLREQEARAFPEQQAIPTPAPEIDPSQLQGFIAAAAAAETQNIKLRTYISVMNQMVMHLMSARLMRLIALGCIMTMFTWAMNSADAWRLATACLFSAFALAVVYERREKPHG